MHDAQEGRSRVLHPALAEVPGHLVWRAAARVTATLDQQLPVGIDLHAYAVLLALAGDVTRSQQELADTVSTSRTTMARVATDLVAQGLVERVRNPDDRRSYALTRTPAGADAAQAWERHAAALQDSLTAAFTRAQSADLLELLQRLASADVAPDAPEALRGSLGFLINRIHFHMHRDFLEALEEIRLEPRLYGSLRALAATGPITQSDLARLLGVSGASVVQIVDALEDRGLAERRRDPADRRSQMLHLLPEAPGVTAQARRIAQRTFAPRFAALTEPEMARLVTLLQEFVTAP